MREILFKGKRKDNFEWVYGSYLIRTNPCIEFFYFAEDGVPEPDIVEVIPETICQYTEMNDKNGKKIFEGDIVKSDMWDTGIAVFKDGHFTIKRNGKNYDIYIISTDSVEIVGNIFDNKELLGNG